MRVKPSCNIKGGTHRTVEYIYISLVPRYIAVNHATLKKIDSMAPHIKVFAPYFPMKQLYNTSMYNKLCDIFL